MPLTIPRARGEETALEVKEVIVTDPATHAKRRYVVCFNPKDVARDAAMRGEILESLTHKLADGDKALLGNAGYRHFLKTARGGHFEIDPARVADDAQFDGLYVLRTNSTLPMLAVALAYRQLWKVEAIFRTAKSILDTRPVFHQCDAAIVGHLCCSFWGLVPRKTSMTASPSPGSIPNGTMSSAISIASKRSPSISRPSASSCAVPHPAVPAPSSRRSASLSRPSPARSPSPSRHPRHRPRQPRAGTTAAWCHAVLIFPNQPFKSTGSRLVVLNFS